MKTQQFILYHIIKDYYIAIHHCKLFFNFHLVDSYKESYLPTIIYQQIASFQAIINRLTRLLIRVIFIQLLQLR